MECHPMGARYAMCVANPRPMRGTSLPPLLADHAAESVRHDVHNARTAGRIHQFGAWRECPPEHVGLHGRMPCTWCRSGCARSHARSGHLWIPMVAVWKRYKKLHARTLDRDRPTWGQLRLGARLPPVDAERGEWTTWLATSRVFFFRTPLSGDRDFCHVMCSGPGIFLGPRGWGCDARMPHRV